MSEGLPTLAMWTDGCATGPRLDSSGHAVAVDEAEAVRESLRMLLATRRGERVMRPEYGSELHRLVFSPNDATTAGLAMHYARRAVERWEPRAKLVGVDASPGTAKNGNPNALTIRLTYRLPHRAQPERLEFHLNLRGDDDGGTETRRS